METLLAFLPALITQIPAILVMVVGITLAIVRWQRHPRVSLLLVVALALRAILALSQPLLQAIIISRNDGISGAATLLGIVGVVSNLAYAVLLGLILWAALGWRNPPAPNGR